MRTSALAVALLAATGATALAAPTVTLSDPETGKATYRDACSNGKNSDAPTREKFVAAVRANKASKLAQTEAQLLKDNPDDQIVYGAWTQTFHEREGCSDTSQSFSAFLGHTEKTGNTHLLKTAFVVTIDDDVAGKERTFHVRAITPITIR